ncbi:MAG: SPASM domain-containing protein, partial [Acidobacteriota bacterium]|nr:SPASM domain-containing protein [Acidobacteriota bacterium]
MCGGKCHTDPKIVHKKDGDLVTIGLRVEPEELLPYYRGPYSGCSIPEEDRLEDAPLCVAANRYANITASGDVMACNILPGSGGNVNEKSFREIWESSPWLRKIRSIRKKDLHTCNTCDRLKYCGRCHAQALAEDGDLYGPSS